LECLKIGLEKSSNIVQSLNQFSRSNSSFDEECEIHSIIENCLLMLNNELKHNVTVEKQYSEEELSLKGNSGKLHQVMLNILSNASHAVENNGIITIKTEKINNTLNIMISDNGSGISKENLRKITDPFFTTKEPGKGTGLGLSITYAIIQEHKGELEFESEEGFGTTVNIRIPI